MDEKANRTVRYRAAEQNLGLLSTSLSRWPEEGVGVGRTALGGNQKGRQKWGDKAKIGVITAKMGVKGC